MFFDPIRDIYEVNDGQSLLPFKSLTTPLGFHDIHILPTLDKFHRG